jgi:MscS family membrane protein
MDLLTNSATFFSSGLDQFLNSVYISVPNWKWLFIFLGFSFLNLIKNFVIHGIKSIKKSQKRLAEKNIFLNRFLDLEIEKGISYIILSICAMILVENLELTTNLEKYLLIFCKVIFSYNMISVIYLATDAFGSVMQSWSSSTSSHIDDQLAPLATKTLKVLVIIVGGLVVLQNFGVNVTALLAGLGIGGVALAFAAQDTVANVFGTVTILLDSPFRLGDRIKILDIDGKVEDVGFRSTRIRTFYNSVVTLPNSVVAKEKIDNLTNRENIFRFRTTLGFTYASTPIQIQNFCEHLRYYLKQDPAVDQTRIIVNFVDFAESSMNVLVNFHYKTNDPDLETLTNESYLLQIQKLVEDQKLSFAFPTRTLVIENSVGTRN